MFSANNVIEIFVKNENGELVRPSSDQIYKAADLERTSTFHSGVTCMDIEKLKAVMRHKYSGLDFELYTVLYLDDENCLIEEHDMVDLNFRKIVEAGLQRQAKGVIIVKNDPFTFDHSLDIEMKDLEELRKTLELLKMNLKNYLKVVNSHVEVWKK